MKSVFDIEQTWYLSNSGVYKIDNGMVRVTTWSGMVLRQIYNGEDNGVRITFSC